MALDQDLQRSWLDRVMLIGGIAGMAYLAYCVFLCLYRLTFHPLAKYPGPLLCRVGWLYQTYFEAILCGKMLERLPGLHEKYGPVVRINPGEVHIQDPVVFHEIYKQNSRFMKDPVAYTQGLPHAISMLFDISQHKKRRETLNPSFSKRRVLLLEDMMYEEVDRVMAKAMTYVEQQKPVPIGDAYYCYTADVISQYLFGKSIDLISQPDFARKRVEDLRSFTNTIWITIHFGFLRKILLGLPRWAAKIANEGLLNIVVFCEGLAKEAIDNYHSGKFDLSKPKALAEETIFDRLFAGNEEVKDEDNFSNKRRPPPMSFAELSDESVGLIAAGTETTATMLAYGTYYFLKFPETQSRILHELDSIPLNAEGRMPIVQIEALPYFTGFVKETLRFAHGVPGRLTRVIPEGGLYVPAINDHIPAGCVVGMSHMMIHMDPEIFEAPQDFRPERWLGEDGKKLEHWLLAFSKGSRDCLGLNLAYTEMHLMLANMFVKFDMSLAPGSHEDMVWDDRAIIRPRGNLKVLAKERV